MRAYYIAGDAHCSTTDLAVVTPEGRVVKRQRCPTRIPELVKFLETIPRPRYLTFEEAPLADWLWRNLSRHVDRLVICNPRRNHLIAKESDKDDPIDALKLAELFRGGYLKEVYHPQCFERAVFKQHLGVYHERVEQRVREANRILAQFRRHGVFLHEKDFVDAEERPGLLKRLPHRLIRSDVELLWQSYDAVAQQVEQFHKSVTRLARKEEVIRRFSEVPGVAWIRGATFYAYLDTPWRFKSKARLWRYLGIGLDRWHSGSGPMRVFVYQGCSRVLRNMILGAAKSAVVHGDNPFADQYSHWIKEEGMTPPNARRNVARSLAMALWGMWKNGSAYRPERVGCPSAVRVAVETR